MTNSRLPDLLRECPLCGKQPELSNPDTLHPSGIYWRDVDDLRVYVSHKERAAADQPVWSMNCPTPSGGCGMEIRGDSRDETIAAWNRRPSPAPLPDELTREPLGYCIVNVDGEMYWGETCIADNKDDLYGELEILQHDEPDDEWKIVPFYALRSSHPESREQGETKAVPAGMVNADQSDHGLVAGSPFDSATRPSADALLGTAPSSARAELVERLRERARIRRQIPTRKSVQEGQPDRIADLLEEAATALSAREGEIYEKCARICREQDVEFHRRYGTYEPAVLCERAILSARSKSNV